MTPWSLEGSYQRFGRTWLPLFMVCEFLCPSETVVRIAQNARCCDPANHKVKCSLPWNTNIFCGMYIKVYLLGGFRNEHQAARLVVSLIWSMCFCYCPIFVWTFCSEGPRKLAGQVKLVWGLRYWGVLCGVGWQLVTYINDPRRWNDLCRNVVNIRARRARASIHRGGSLT